MPVPGIRGSGGPMPDTGIRSAPRFYKERPMPTRHILLPAITVALMCPALLIAAPAQEPGIRLDDEEETLQKLNEKLKAPSKHHLYRVGFGDEKSKSPINPGKYAPGKGYGLVTDQGKVIFRPGRYKHIFPMANNLYIVQKDGKYGVIDETENFIVPPKYDKISYRWDQNFVIDIFEKTEDGWLCHFGQYTFDTSQPNSPYGHKKPELLYSKSYKLTDEQYQRETQDPASEYTYSLTALTHQERPIFKENEYAGMFNNSGIYTCYEGHEYINDTDRVYVDRLERVSDSKEFYNSGKSGAIRFFDDDCAIIEDANDKYRLLSLRDCKEPKDKMPQCQMSKAYKNLDMASAGNGLACITDKKKSGFINAKDQMVIETPDCEYSVTPFIDGLAYLKPKGATTFALYDRNGVKKPNTFEIAADRAILLEDGTYRFQTQFPTKSGWKYNEVVVLKCLGCDTGKIIYPRDWDDPCHDTGGNIIWPEGACSK